MSGVGANRCLRLELNQDDVCCAVQLFRFMGVSLICSGGWRLMTSWFNSEKSTNTPCSGWDYTGLLVAQPFVDKCNERTAQSFLFSRRQQPWQGDGGVSTQDDTSLLYSFSQRGFSGVNVKLMKRPDELSRKRSNQWWRRRRVRRSNSKISKFQRWNGCQPASWRASPGCQDSQLSRSAHT